MLLHLTRALRFALQSFWRNVWLSVATITIMALSLLSVQVLAVTTVISNQALSELQGKVDVSVYLKPGLTDKDITGLHDDVAKISGVSSVQVVTAEQALADFKVRHAADPVITESLSELGGNPLGATLVVRAGEPSSYPSILQQLQADRFAAYVQETRFDDYQKVIDGITTLTSRVTRAGQGVSLAFLLIAVLVVFNTIRVNIYSRREEVSIMRLVGASAWFIRSPYLIESVLYALLATLVTTAVFFGGLSAVQPYLGAFFGGTSLNLVQYFSERWFWYFGLEFIGAAGLSALASFVALRRYLKV